MSRGYRLKIGIHSVQTKDSAGIALHSPHMIKLGAQDLLH
jgi:hypothetical protein